MITKVLITGAKGQLAKTMQQLFGQKKDDIAFAYVSKKELDITDKSKVNLFLKKNDFDYCINCAAFTNVEQAEKTPETAFSINADAVKNLAEVCYETNCILIHISTDYVFDGKKKGAYTVNDAPNPINVYGASKLLGESYIQDTLEKYFIIRTSWLYSKKFGHNFYQTIVRKSKTEKTLFITDTQIGCPTNTINLSYFIFSIIYEKSEHYGLKHFCDSIPMTWFNFAKSILVEHNISNQIKLVKTTKYSTFAQRPKNSVLLNSK